MKDPIYIKRDMKLRRDLIAQWGYFQACIMSWEEIGRRNAEVATLIMTLEWGGVMCLDDYKCAAARVSEVSRMAKHLLPMSLQVGLIALTHPALS